MADSSRVASKKQFHSPNSYFGSHNDSQGWKQKFNNADFGAQKSAQKERPLIQWAGGLHQRGDFNKKRDQLGTWTEVLFHH